MLRLAANLTMLFTEVAFLDRFREAADAGFDAVEFQFPYDFDPRDIRRALTDHDLRAVLHNMPAGDWARGERGIACLPDRIAEFKAGVDRAITYATALDCRRVNCLAGIRPPSLPEEDARHTLVRNLQFAAPRFRAAGIRLLVEPLNTRDVPGFFLCGTAQARDIIEAVGSDNVFLQYDAYHMQMMEGALQETIEANRDRIAHIQIADAPGRHEPGTGAIDYPALLDVIRRSDYQGWVGCEYVPATTTRDGLGWARPYLQTGG